MSDKKAVTVELWALVDADGEYAVGVDRDTAREAFEEQVGAPTDPTRLVRVVVEVPVPEPAVLRGVAPDVGEASLTAIE